ncbi:MAG: 3-deoxy-D-manno-octulosonate 8-phosphate phosphatase [Bacteroidota bacterium]
MNFLEKFREIDTFVLDVDGVLTNGELLIMEDGSLLRKMNVRDGYAIKRAIEEGYEVAVISGGHSEGVIKRLGKLGITTIYTNVKDKKSCYLSFTELNNLDHAGILYMGDDLPDYEVMRLVGLPCCPRDAAVEILELSQYISPVAGGKGCVRDVIEKVLRLHGRWHIHAQLQSIDPLINDSES